MRRALTLVAFAAIVVAGIDRTLLRIPFYSRAELQPVFERYADGTWQQYAVFLRGVRAHTRNGERVAVIVPAAKWERGYSYAYYRASYLLAGREVLPLVDERDRFRRENLLRADVVASWRAPVPATHPNLVWSGDGGVLVRR
jgi:hypothetical protein